MNKILLLLVLTTVTACSWDRNNPDKFWYYPQAGTKLVLHERLVFRPGTASLYMQYGEITGTKHSRFDPYCKIRIRNVTNAEQFLNPDTFTITRSGRHTELVAGLTGVSIPLEVNSRPKISVSVSNSAAPSDITEVVFMNLSSVKQPDVMYMVCGGVEDHPAEAEPPTFKEIKAAVGRMMTFK